MVCLMSDFQCLCPISNKSTSLVSIYKRHERENKQAYGQRVREVEYASFSPLVFSSTGSLGRETTCIFKRLASKWYQPYSITLNWMRISFSFTDHQCLRGARSKCGNQKESQILQSTSSTPKIFCRALDFHIH